ncbi:MAG: hypothetical protein OXG62_06390 [Nitrospinae bacterium]|nr:hypothetical protein [Nitrospinota bacterium]
MKFHKCPSCASSKDEAQEGVFPLPVEQTVKGDAEFDILLALAPLALEAHGESLAELEAPAGSWFAGSKTRKTSSSSFNSLVRSSW